MSPRISVIIPVFNRAQWVAEAIESVLAQGMADVEIICIDDGSTDDSAQVVQSFGASVVYRWQENKGVSAARNVGLRLVRSPFVTFLDSDDLFPAGKLARQLAILAANPTLGLVMGKVEHLFLPSADPEMYTFTDQNRITWTVQLGAGLYRTAVFEQVGCFDETLPMGEDLDWFNRVKEQGVPMQTIDDVMIYYRLHDTNMTLNRTVLRQTALRAMKLSLDRRRTNGAVANLPQFADFMEPKPNPANV